jgi:hypothetical protein
MHGRINRRVGTHKEQFQPFIWKLRRQGHLAFLPQQLESRLTRFGYSPMTHKIDKGAARRRQQPGLRILRHAISRPSRECCYQCVAASVLSAGHVTARHFFIAFSP